MGPSKVQTSPLLLLLLFSIVVACPCTIMHPISFPGGYAIAQADDF